jgi:repressor LexA
MPLTQKQRAFLNLLLELVERNHVPPSLREIQAAGRFASTRSVVQYLNALQDAGFIQRGVGSRNLRILRPADNSEESAHTVSIPVIGEVAAGSPILAEENVVDHRPVSANLVRRGSHHFLLRVRGDSMNEAGIQDGDLVLVRQQTTARSGERVVALIDNDATVKRLRLGTESAILEPVSSNPKHKPIIVGRDFRIQGIVVVAIPKER